MRGHEQHQPGTVAVAELVPPPPPPPPPSPASVTVGSHPVGSNATPLLWDVALCAVSDPSPLWSREIIGSASARPVALFDHNRVPTMSSSPHASQYPPPPDGDAAHYTPIYATAQSLDGPAPRAPYPPPPEPPFPKLENINEVLQAQQALHANHAQILPPHSPASQQPKPNRLRKACDSCSARKVKVGLGALVLPAMAV